MISHIDKRLNLQLLQRNIALFASATCFWTQAHQMQELYQGILLCHQEMDKDLVYHAYYR